jgi:hypothetical protein
METIQQFAARLVETLPEGSGGHRSAFDPRDAAVEKSRIPRKFAERKRLAHKRGVFCGGSDSCPMVLIGFPHGLLLEHRVSMEAHKQEIALIQAWKIFHAGL